MGQDQGGIDRTRAGRGRRTARALLALLVALGGLALAPRPAAATEPEVDEFELLDVPALPAYDVVAGGRSRFVASTAEGLVAEQYGTGPDADRDRFFQEEDYPDLPTASVPNGGGSITMPTTGFTDMALGDVNSDGHPDRVGVTSDGATGRIRVDEDQSEGWHDFLAGWQFSGVPLGIVIWDRASEPTLIGVATTTGFHQFTYDGTSKLKSEGNFLNPAPGIEPGDVLDVYQRNPDDKYAWEPDGFANEFVVLGRRSTASGGDGTDLRASVITWNGLNSFTDKGHYEVPRDAAVSRAAVRYDLSDVVVTSDRKTITYTAYHLGVLTYGASGTVLRGDDDSEKTVWPGLLTRVTPGVGDTGEGTWIGTEPACETTEPDAVPTLDVEVASYPHGLGSLAGTIAPRWSELVGCAAIGDGASAATARTRVETTVFRHDYDFPVDAPILPNRVESAVTFRSVVTGAPGLTRPAVQVTHPCDGWLDLQEVDDLATNGCRKHSDRLGVDYLEPGRTAGSSTTLYRSGGTIRRATSSSTSTGGSTFGDDHEVASGVPADSGPIHLLPLGADRWHVQLQVTNRNHPRTVTSNPVPLALLAVPPYVRGAGQAVSPAEFARTATSGSSSSVSGTSSWHVTVGMDWEDPTGQYAVGATTTTGQEFEDTEETSVEESLSEFFQGTEDENAVVYQTLVEHEYDGRVLTSSTGIGYDDQDVPIRFPVTRLTDVATLDTFLTLRAAASAQYRDGLLSALPTPGDPRTYPQGLGTDAAPSSAVSSYCTTPTRSTGDLRTNPYISNPPALRGAGILLGNQAVVTAGAGGSAIQGTSFSIDSATANTRATTLTLEGEGHAKVVAGTVEAGGGHSWGNANTTSLATGTSFGSGVGDIPGLGPDTSGLGGEGYRWQSFLCQRKLTSASGVEIPVWVLSYAVADYTGSGGLEPLGAITPTAPVASASVAPASTIPFQWDQETGSVRSFDLELEAVGKPDRRTFANLLPLATPGAATVRPTNLSQSLSFANGTSSPLDDALLENQLYRWRVTATDFFGNRTTSPYEFFTTQGRARNVQLDVSNPTPTVGESVTLRIDHEGGPVAGYRFRLGDGRVVPPVGSPPQSSPTLTTSWSTAGLFVVQGVAESSFGSASDTGLVSVGLSAEDDTGTVDEDGVLTVPAPGVLANDSSSGSLSVVVPPSHGTVTLRPDGGYTYRPVADYCGSDAFGYQLTSGSLTKQATVRLTVDCRPDRPVAGGSTLTILEDHSGGEAAPGLLLRASDADAGSTLTAHLATAPDHGDAAVATDGSYVYAPEPGYCGPDAFTWVASDGGLPRSLPATVSVTVTCVNDAPVAVDDGPLLVFEDSAGVDVPVLENDRDPEEDPLAVRIVDVPSSGTASVTSAGRMVRYVPTADACGSDQLTYVASDGALESAPATVRLSVVCVDDPPTLRASDPVLGTEDAPVAYVPVVDDPDGGAPAEVVLTRDPAHGSVQGVLGAFVYTPDADWCGTDAFGVTLLGDVVAEPHEQDVEVRIACVNDAPLAGPTRHHQVDAGVTLNAAAPGALAGASDVDGDRLTASLASAPGHGTAIVAADGSYTYTANRGYCGADAFAVAVSDGSATASSTVELDVRCPTTVEVTSSANPVATGEAITFTATVRSDGGTPTGAVAFRRDGVVVPGCAAVTLTDEAVATCSVATLPAGTWTMSADYAGSPDPGAAFEPSSGSLTQVVARRASVLTTDPAVLKLASLKATLGLTARLTDAVTGAPLAGRTITFTTTVGTQSFTAVTDDAGVAKVQSGWGLVYALRALGHIATFTGDASHDPSEARSIAIK